MTLLLACVVIQLGCFFLCCSMSKHFRKLYPSVTYTQSIRRSLLCVGYVCLVIGLGFCLRVDPLSVALTTFMGIITVAIVIVALVLGIKRTVS